MTKDERIASAICELEAALRERHEVFRDATEAASGRGDTNAVTFMVNKQATRHLLRLLADIRDAVNSKGGR